MRLPDFIIIGAMKCATSTLYEQLFLQPGIRLSNPKEPNFFSDDLIYANGLEWYGSLFDDASEGELLGEASTYYTKLPAGPNTVMRIQKHVPDAKFIYVMRHPVDRLISHYMHEWSQSVMQCDINSAIDEYPELIDYSRYAYQLKPYLDAFGQGQVLPVFFERMLACPQQELERICSFIGYEEKPAWQKLVPQNVSSERIRRFPGYELLIENSSLTWLRRNLIPKGVRNRFKSRLQMQDKPSLSDENAGRIEAIFDIDLRQLGKLLGVELNCSSFKSTVRDRKLNWLQRL